MDLRPEALIVSVSQVNEYIKKILSQDENLKYLLVKGEISNFKVGPNGHCYFSLKDKKSVISAVMFSFAAKTLAFMPKDGDEVVCFASVSVYEVRGSYQLYVERMEAVGQGKQLVELEELKKKLQAEGLFDESRKRKIDIYPNAIGVISALNSAALEDILTNVKRRYPIADIYVFPALVQGQDAPNSLLKAFERSQKYPLDTLIIGRGGGASEDLSAFNDETLVRAVATSKMPVIAAVGHEVDFTLIDFVADVRVSTPTGAAERATVDKREILQKLDDMMSDMKNSLKEKIDDIKIMILDYNEDLESLIAFKFKDLKNKITSLDQQLEALNPTAILKRGYSITSKEDGTIVKSKNDIVKGEKIKTTLSDGVIESEVK